MKVFVRNIPWSASEKELQDLLEFNGYADVQVKIVTDRETGNSKGFGFLTFISDQEGERALAELDGIVFLGRTLQVLPSTSPDRASRGHTSRPSSGQARPPSVQSPVATSPSPSSPERLNHKKSKGHKGNFPRPTRFVSRRGGDDYDID